ncbi:MAG: DUF4493 domain-containing protein [Rikenellaceae bacterium]
MRAYLYNIMFAALLLTGCVKSGEALVGTSAEAGYGKVALNVATQSTIATRTSGESDRFELPEEYIPTADEIELRIVGTYLDVDDDLKQKEYDQTFESVAAYNELLPYIPAGDYTASVYHEGEAGAIFAGEVAFTVVARRLDAEESLTAVLQNSGLRVEATTIFLGYFGGGATLVISTSAGDEFTFVYPTDEEPTILFVDAELELYLEGEATKQPTTESGRAETVTLTKQKIGTTAATTISRIEVDAAAAGGATITVKLNDTITSYTESDLELNPFS